ncbi:lipopolysaccharide biosynthesis protein [Salinisphaera aquimarina]|uniref:Lipopolysaccharide biosynthesis protein n=1 Tax=Salinisphaera aquimarina TaxID=2094031 RepID=A0ABV7EQ19_9GAMM
MAKSSPAAPMSVRRSLVWSFGRRYTNLLMTLPTVMIVSRLLTPAQVGVYSLAFTFVTLVHALRDFGVSDYLVQARDLDDSMARSAFTINLSIAWLLALLVFAGSGLVAHLYGEAGLQTVLQILALNFILLPFGSTVNALLKRTMQFGIIYRINLAQQATQSAVTIGLAYLGFSYYSMAWGSVFGMVATIIGCMTWGRHYRIRGLGLHHWRDVTHFGIHRTTADIISQVGNAAPDFVIARALDFAAVGLFSRGKGLINMFRQNILAAIGQVTFPAYARDNQRAQNAHLLYLKSTTYVTGFSWPFLLFAALMAFPIMRIMFGDQWDGAVPILQLLAIAAVVSVVNMDTPQLLVAIGRAGLVTRMTLITQLFRLMVLIITAFYGLTAIAAGQILVSAVNSSAWILVLCRHTSMTVGDCARAVVPSLISTAITMVMPCVLVVMAPPSADNLFLPLLLGGIATGLSWLMGLWLTSHPLWDEMADWRSMAMRRIGMIRT